MSVRGAPRGVRGVARGAHDTDPGLDGRIEQGPDVEDRQLLTAPPDPAVTTLRMQLQLPWTLPIPSTKILG